MNGIAFKGTDFDLKIDSSLVATATDWSVTPNREMIEITTISSGRTKVYIPDRTDYSMSINGLVFRSEGAGQLGYMKMLNKMMTSDTSINWSGTLLDTSAFLSGWGYITSAPIQVAQGSAVTYSIEIQGCGNITVNTAL